MVQFREMSLEEIAAWLPAMWKTYIDERRNAGEDVEALRLEVARQQELLFPEGRLAEGQHIMAIVAGDHEVGTIWLGRPFNGALDMWFVYDIEIDKTLRGQGYGRAAMESAEGWTRERGGRRLGLNVFGPNTVARALYDSLNYQVFATSMFKDVDPRDS